MAVTDKPLYELDEHELFLDRKNTFMEDLQWRMALNLRYTHCAYLYEKQEKPAGRYPEGGDDEFPESNKIRRAINDYVSSIASSIPSISFVATIIEDAMAEDESIAAIKNELIADTQTAMVKVVRTILEKSDFYEMRMRVIRQAGIFGSGYVLVDLDTSLDVRNNPDLRRLLMKNPEEISMADLRRIETAAKNIMVRHIDTRGVVWQRGQVAPDENMHRVSIVERLSVPSARAIYRNDRIKPNTVNGMEFPMWQNVHDAVDIITTWELVPVPVSLMGIEITDWIMVKTIYTLDQLLEVEIYDSSEGPACLPVVPFYLLTSTEHPYGHSLALTLEKSQKFINVVRRLIYQHGWNQVRPDSLLVMGSTLAKEDIEAIDKVISEGGVHVLKGPAFDRYNSINDIVMHMGRFASPLDPALVQMLQLESANLQELSEGIDLKELARARTGAGKRAQIAAADRPKTISLIEIGASMERLYDTILEFIRTYYRDRTRFMVLDEGNENRQIVLNEKVRRKVLETDEQGLPIRNPMTGEYLLRDKEFTLNDVSIPLKAVSDARGPMPTDPYMKLNLLGMYLQLGAILPDTLREVALPDAIKRIDDINRKKAAEAQAQQAQLQQALLSAAQGAAGASPAEQDEKTEDNVPVPPEGAPPAELTPQERADISMMRGM